MPRKKKGAAPALEADARDADAQIAAAETVDVSQVCETCKYSDEHGSTDGSEICGECAESEALFPNWELRTFDATSTTPADTHWLAKETITVTQELTQAEKADYAEEMANAQCEKDRLEMDLDGIKKSYKRLIDAEDAKISLAAKIVRNGKEERSILCDKVADYDACDIVWCDAHPPHVEVQRRKMTAEERQLPLEKKAKPEADTVGADDELPAVRSCDNCRHLEREGCEAECDIDGMTGWEPIIPVEPAEAEPAAAALIAMQQEWVEALQTLVWSGPATTDAHQKANCEVNAACTRAEKARAAWEELKDE